MADRRLTGKQQAFLTNYLDGGMKNAAAAYRLAYDTQASPVRVGQMASELLRHPLIAPKIAEAEAKADAALAHAISRFGLSREALVERLAAMVTYDVRDVLQWANGKLSLRDSADLPAGAAQAISGAKQRADGTIEVQFADRRAAAELLAKLRGWLVERRDMRVVRSIEDLTDDELRALAGPADETEGRKH